MEYNNNAYTIQFPKFIPKLIRDEIFHIGKIFLLSAIFYSWLLYQELAGKNTWLQKLDFTGSLIGVGGIYCRLDNADDGFSKRGLLRLLFL